MTQALRNLKNLHCNGVFLTKVYNVWAWKVQRGYAGDTQDWYTVWRKTDLCFWKWHEEFGKFSPGHSKVLKFGHWWHPFVAFNDTEYLCKIWRKTELCFWKLHGEFSKFSPEHIRKSKSWDCDGILLSKVENVWA